MSEGAKPLGRWIAVCKKCRHTPVEPLSYHPGRYCAECGNKHSRLSTYGHYEQQEPKCPNCGAARQSGKFCRACGCEIKAAKKG